MLCRYIALHIAISLTAEADTWQQICVGFVQTVKDFMPSLLRKQKVHYFLHLAESMENYGPTSAFSAER